MAVAFFGSDDGQVGFGWRGFGDLHGIAGKDRSAARIVCVRFFLAATSHCVLATHAFSVLARDGPLRVGKGTL